MNSLGRLVSYSKKSPESLFAKSKRRCSSTEFPPASRYLQTRSSNFSKFALPDSSFFCKYAIITLRSISAESFFVFGLSPTKISIRNLSMDFLFRLARTPRFSNQRKRNHCSSLYSEKITVGASNGEVHSSATLSIISSAIVSKLSANFKCKAINSPVNQNQYKWKPIRLFPVGYVQARRDLYGKYPSWLESWKFFQSKLRDP